MTSRDGSNRNKRPISNPDRGTRAQQRPRAQWEVDAEDLNRYMSGQPSRQPRFDPYGRSQSAGRTERPQPSYQQPEPQYDDTLAYEEDAWEEDSGADQFEDDVYVEPVPARTRAPQRPTRQTQRSRVQEPEFADDDLYEDPYVLDDEEAPRRRPQRPAQRPTRPRQQRQAPSFSLPPALTNTPIVADRKSLAMIGVLAVSLLAMIIVVAMRRDLLDASIFTHVNANGEPENLQGTSAAWRMPLIAGMVTLINVVLGWFMSRWGMFLPRFLLGGAFGIHFVVWVAIFAYFF